MSAEKLYQELVETTRNISFLQGTQALLEWDQQTKLPKLAGSHRSEQVTFLASEIHRHSTAERLGGILQELSDSELARDPHSDSGATIRELKRNFDKKTKLPPKLVEELARTTANGQQVWIEARQENDFAKFAPVLKQIFELKRNEAEALGYEDCRYDALLDEYEPHAKTKEVAAVLDGLKQELVPLVAASRKVSTSQTHRS